MEHISNLDRKFTNTGTHQKVLVPEEFSLLVSSDPVNGAINRTADGAEFSIVLGDPIKIPPDAKNVNVSLESATIWWTVPNIITNQNDRLYITVPDAADVLTAYNIQIPQGLYDLVALNEAIQRELENAGAKTSPDQTIQLLSDEATQKVEIRLNYDGSEIDFTQADTFRDILGFNAQNIGPIVGAPQIILADNAAAFNQVNSFLIHSDIVDNGIRINGDYNQILSEVLIDVRPGSQIIFRPFNPAKIPVPSLAGAQRSNIRFRLTDDKNRAVNTANEFWTARLKFSYLHPHWI